MAAIYLARRALLNITIGKSLTESRNTTRLCTASFSSAFERAEGANAVAESEKPRHGTSGMSNEAKETMKDGLHEAKQQAKDMTGADTDEGVTGFVADKAKQGAVKATEMAENVGDTAKETMDGAWQAAKETTQSIKEAVTGPVETNENVIDMQDYRNNVEDLRNRAGGYDKGEGK